jgi:hypothetical protein
MAIGLLTLALLGTVLYAWSLLQGHLVSLHRAPVAGHFLVALAATVILVMAHSFIMFFLLATGVELKDMEKAAGWGDSFRRRTIRMKSVVFPVMTLAILAVMANFILGAGAHTHAIPPWAHGALGWTTLVISSVALYREYVVLGDNNRLIAEAGERRRAAGRASS